jgi:4-aminobutyrate aminotransferase
MIGIEFVADKKAKSPAGEQRDHVVELAFERGILFLGCGSNTLRISPPLVVTKQQADLALDVLEECILAVGLGNYQRPSWGEEVGA